MSLERAQHLVTIWREKMGLPVAHHADPPAVRDPTLHARLLREECAEACEALIAGDIVEVADGLADLIVVALGCAAECGIDLGPVFDEVMKSNATKEPGNYDSGGKLGKGERFVRPDIAGVLRAQGWKG